MTLAAEVERALAIRDSRAIHTEIPLSATNVRVSVARVMAIGFIISVIG